jgi:hypothetical protein
MNNRENNPDNSQNNSESRRRFFAVVGDGDAHLSPVSLSAGEGMLPAALEYAARGWHVFPLGPKSKKPLPNSNGFYGATTNPETIKRLWTQSDRNIGIRTGAPSGFWVLDIDGDEGEASLRALELRHGRLPPTPEAITGGGGRHLSFKYTGPVSNSAKKMAPGLDVRGDGGYVVAPPSIHESGRAYAWSVDSVATLPTAPAWLLELARKKPTPPTITQRAITTIRPGSSGAYGRAALDRECAALAAMAPNSGRNCALNLAAFRLGQLVAGGRLERDQVYAGLIDACHRNGLIHDDGMAAVQATIRSGGRAGMKHPRGAA